jgi:hypothetical protein
MQRVCYSEKSDMKVLKRKAYHFLVEIKIFGTTRFPGIFQFSAK